MMVAGGSGSLRIWAFSAFTLSDACFARAPQRCRSTSFKSGRVTSQLMRTPRRGYPDDFTETAPKGRN